MVQIELSKQQAKDFARAIIADIDSYVEQHLPEFEAFLKSEFTTECEVSKDAND